MLGGTQSGPRNLGSFLSQHLKASLASPCLFSRDLVIHCKENTFLQSFKKSCLNTKKPSLEKLCLLGFVNYKVHDVWLRELMMEICFLCVLGTFPWVGNELGAPGGACSTQGCPGLNLPQKNELKYEMFTCVKAALWGARGGHACPAEGSHPSLQAPCALSINCPLTWNHNAALLIMDYSENLFKQWLGLGQVLPSWPWVTPLTQALLLAFICLRNQKLSDPSAEDHLKNPLLWFTWI